MISAGFFHMHKRREDMRRCRDQYFRDTLCPSSTADALSEIFQNKKKSLRYMHSSIDTDKGILLRKVQQNVFFTHPIFHPSSGIRNCRALFPLTLGKQGHPHLKHTFYNLRWTRANSRNVTFTNVLRSYLTF